MSLASSLLCLMITSIPAQVEKQAAMPDRLRGQFLDLFDGDKIQLSIGSDQGVRTGLTGFVIRTSPEPHSYGAEVEFVEVDGKHSIAKIRSHHSPYGPVYDNPYAIGLTLISPPFAKGSFGASVKSVKNNRLKVNDSFD